MIRLAHLLLTVIVVAFAFGGLLQAVGLEYAKAEGTAGGKAVYGHGMIRYGGLGPEAWRWEKLRSDRRAARLQSRLTVRVLEVRSLKRELALLERLNLDPILAIRVVFGPYSAQAIRVSSCETGGTFHTGAQNGQYLGLFQMGSYARATYGHSSTALGQARAAYRYFLASGRDWSPWECRP